jgi:hypothetical protein
MFGNDTFANDLVRLKAAGCKCRDTTEGRPTMRLPNGQTVRLGPGISDDSYSTMGAKTQRRRLACHGCGTAVVFDEPTPATWWRRIDEAAQRKTRTALNHRKRRAARRARRAAR